MSPRPIAVIQKSSDLLQLLATQGPLRSADIADQIGMPRSSVYRLVDALNAAGLTTTQPDARVKLGLRVLQLAESAKASRTEWQSSQPLLNALATQTGLTAYLSEPYGTDKVICVDWSPGSAMGILILRPGRTLPLHAGAAGRVTLAHSAGLHDYLSRAPFPRFTSRTLTTARTLTKDAAQTRGRGYVLSDEDVTDGIGALGVPIIGASQGFLGALSVAGLAEDIRERQPELLTVLTRASVKLGRSGPAAPS